MVCPPQAPCHLADDLGVKTSRYNGATNLRATDSDPYQPGPVLGPSAVASRVARLQRDVNSERQRAESIARGSSARLSSTADLRHWLDDNATTPMASPGLGSPRLGRSRATSAAARARLNLGPLTRTARSLPSTDNTAGGAQDSRFVGGSQKVSIRLAKRLDKRVVLRAAVRRLTQERGLVRAVCDDGTYTGKHVIVTAPPAVTAYIDYEPKLPADRAQLLQRFPQGSCIKCHAVYKAVLERCGWRAVTSDEPVGSPSTNHLRMPRRRVGVRRSCGPRLVCALGKRANGGGLGHDHYSAMRRPRTIIRADGAEQGRGVRGLMPPGADQYGEAIGARKRISMGGLETAHTGTVQDGRRRVSAPLKRHSVAKAG